MNSQNELQQNGPAQEFWLQNLGEADRFNSWVFSKFSDYLNGPILELGCGTGNFTRLIAENGHQVIGIDIQESFVKIARTRLASFKNVHILHGDILSLGLEQKFETIILLDVLEHIQDDVALLKSFQGLLKPNGRLILKVPSIPSLYSEMDRAIGHYRRYDRAGLRATLSAAGYENTSLVAVNSIGILGWWLNGRVLRRTTPPSGQVSFFNKILPIAAVIEEKLRLPVGLSLISVSQSPQESLEP